MTTTDKPTLLLWLDFETTGLDLKRDGIIEVAAIITTPDLVEIDRYSSPIRIHDDHLVRLMRDDTVREMHTNNGLINDLLAPDAKHPSLRHAEQALVEMIERVTAETDANREVALAGSGVTHFDRPLIKNRMEMLDQRLTYWMVDVGVIRRAHRMWTGEAPSVPDTPIWHRALSDVEAHIETAKAFRAAWTAPPPPGEPEPPEAEWIISRNPREIAAALDAGRAVQYADSGGWCGTLRDAAIFRDAASPLDRDYRYKGPRIETPEDR